VNAAKPWAAQLNERNKIDTKCYLRLICGSHLIFVNKVPTSYLFQEAKYDRVVLILPYLGKTLIRTTEVSQSLLEKNMHRRARIPTKH
jgi:glycerol-3-phosphate dehydrogenase